MDRINISKEDVLNFANINNYDLLQRIKEEENKLSILRKELSEYSDEQFYESIITGYSKKIAEKMLKEFGNDLNEDIINKLKKIENDSSTIVFLSREEGPFGETQSPAAFARNREGKIYFPKYDETTDIIEFTRKKEQLIVHEMFHIVTKNSSEKTIENINNEEISYYPGYIFDEGLVEKCARDFSTKHNLLYHPCVGYIQYAKNIEKFMSKYNIDSNNQLFNINYNEILKIASEEEQKQYYMYELEKLKQKIEHNEKEEKNNPKIRTLKQNNLGYINSIFITLIIIIVTVIGAVLIIK